LTNLRYQSLALRYWMIARSRHHRLIVQQSIIQLGYAGIHIGALQTELQISVVIAYP